MTREEGRGEVVAVLWLHLLKQGGRWRSMEVAAATGVNRREACWQLSGMAARGQVSKFQVPGKRRSFSYGVTRECKVPQAVTVGTMSDCVLAGGE